MADSLLDALGLLRTRIGDLTEENTLLRARNTELEALNADLRQQAEEAAAGRHRAELDAQYLAVSHKLADDPDILIQTRRHIAQLIRNIDRCLEMLKE